MQSMCCVQLLGLILRLQFAHAVMSVCGCIRQQYHIAGQGETFTHQDCLVCIVVNVPSNGAIKSLTGGGECKCNSCSSNLISPTHNTHANIATNPFLYLVIIKCPVRRWFNSLKAQLGPCTFAYKLVLIPGESGVCTNVCVYWCALACLCVGFSN